MCIMLNGLRADGWRPRADGIFDPDAKRGTILFCKGNGEEALAEKAKTVFVCLTVEKKTKRLIVACPTWAEAEVRRKIQDCFTERDVWAGSERLQEPPVMRDYVAVFAAVPNWMSHRKDFKPAVTLTLSLMEAMERAGFHFETSFSAFGDQCDLVMFAYKSGQPRLYIGRR